MVVFTIIQHEPVFFPVWFRHYSKHFDASEIHVLHHRLPSPASPAQEDRRARWEAFLASHRREHGYNLVEVVNEQSFDHEWLRQMVMGKQRSLLKDHEFVLFAEADEIVAPHPDSGFPDLKSYASASRRPVSVCDGYEVVHKKHEEPPLDFSKPVLGQRDWWYWSKIYSKPLLSSRPLNWCWGFHACEEVPLPYHKRDPNLLLVHLHKADWTACLDRNLDNADRPWKDAHFGSQNRLTAEHRLEQWWWLNIDQKTEPATLTRIPPRVKLLV